MTCVGGYISGVAVENFDDQYLSLIDTSPLPGRRKCQQTISSTANMMMAGDDIRQTSRRCIIDTNHLCLGAENARKNLIDLDLAFGRDKDDTNDGVDGDDEDENNDTKNRS